MYFVKLKYVDEYLQSLKHLNGDSNYRAVNAEKYKEGICDAFKSDLISNIIY